jgi:hypothetical protein
MATIRCVWCGLIRPADQPEPGPCAGRYDGEHRWVDPRA